MFSRVLTAGALTAVLAFPAMASALPSMATSNPGADARPTQTPTAESNPGAEMKPATPGPGASAKAKGRAYGKYCKAQSKKRVEGAKGTPFSLCVTAMAKLAGKQATSPRTACKSLSKKRVGDAKGTPFSLCVSSGAKLLKDLAPVEEPTTTTDPVTSTTTPTDPAPATEPAPTTES